MPKRDYRDATDIVFHVVNRAARRAELFIKPPDYEAFLQVVEEGRERTGIPLLAYCVMPNHFHLLVRPTQLGQMSRFMRWFQLTHAKRWHRHRESRGTGAVYQGRYRAIPIETDAHFLVAARYVERNPVRAGLVVRAEQWRWSSFYQRGKNCHVPRLTAWPILPPDNWSALVNDLEAASEVDALRRATRHGTPFGTPVWAQRVSGSGGKDLG